MRKKFNSHKKKIYRKRQKTFKLRGGTYLRQKLNNNSRILHPLNHLVQDNVEDYQIIRLDKNNIGTVDYDNIYFKAFFEKLIQILNISFEREREHSIKKGLYPQGYKHNLESIKSNTHNPSFVTVILCNKNLVPIAFLYVEQKEDDYDKVWTVCTDNEYRGQGISSKLMNWTTINQLNNNRSKMLLEVYDDNVISRGEEDVLQNQIMTHFGKNGFDYTPLEKLDSNTYNNLMCKNGDTKIMIFNPQRWYQEHKNSRLNLNSRGKKICS